VPEGDTIFRTARTLHRALAGRTITSFTSVFPALTRIDHDTPLRGRVIESVTPRGKHLLMSFSGGLVLRTHMRMHGSWHIYRSGERWMRPHHDMRIVIATDEFEAVAFDVPVAEFMTDRDVERRPTLKDLGPDVMVDVFDLDEAVRRIEARPETEIADALLDQQAVAGIGNIFKSESLFRARINPFVRVRDLTSEDIGRAVTMARKLMRSEPRPELRVYMRGGQPCRRCGTRIARRKQGPDARSTYWCEKCQAVTSASRSDPARDSDRQA
jgi:endonuclease VIII